MGSKGKNFLKEGAKVRVNGEEKHVEKTISLDEFLKQEGYIAARIAVEKNGEIVPKAEYANTMLEDKDHIESVHFVGGG